MCVSVQSVNVHLRVCKSRRGGTLMWKGRGCLSETLNEIAEGDRSGCVSSFI